VLGGVFRGGGGFGGVPIQKEFLSSKRGGHARERKGSIFPNL